MSLQKTPGHASRDISRCGVGVLFARTSGMNDSLSIARSGMQSAEVRLRNSAHNIANSSTRDFKNHRTLQLARRGGGSDASTQVDAQSREVSLANESIEQSLAAFQFKASARVVKTDLDLKGSLLDAFA